MEIGNYLQGSGNDRAVKNKWLWAGMNQLGIDVINVGEDDIAELTDLGVDLSKDDHLISANLISSKTGEPLLKPYVVKPISLKANGQEIPGWLPGTVCSRQFSDDRKTELPLDRPFGWRRQVAAGIEGEM